MKSTKSQAVVLKAPTKAQTVAAFKVPPIAAKVAALTKPVNATEAKRLKILDEIKASKASGKPYIAEPAEAAKPSQAKPAKATPQAKPSPVVKATKPTQVKSTPVAPTTKHVAPEAKQATVTLLTTDYGPQARQTRVYLDLLAKAKGMTLPLETLLDLAAPGITSVQTPRAVWVHYQRGLIAAGIVRCEGVIQRGTGERKPAGPVVTSTGLTLAPKTKGARVVKAVKQAAEPAPKVKPEVKAAPVSKKEKQVADFFAQQAKLLADKKQSAQTQH